MRTAAAERLTAAAVMPGWQAQPRPCCAMTSTCAPLANLASSALSQPSLRRDECPRPSAGRPSAPARCAWSGRTRRTPRRAMIVACTPPHPPYGSGRPRGCPRAGANAACSGPGGTTRRDRARSPRRRTTAVRGSRAGRRRPSRADHRRARSRPTRRGCTRRRRPAWTRPSRCPRRYARGPQQPDRGAEFRPVGIAVDPAVPHVGGPVVVNPRRREQRGVHRVIGW